MGVWCGVVAGKDSLAEEYVCVGVKVHLTDDEGA